MTMTEIDPDPRLLIGDVFEDAYSLFSDQSPATRPYEMYVTGEGTTLGNSESITRVVETFLTDLQYIVIDGQGPREMQFTVWVTGDDDRALGRAERDLMAVLYRPTMLWWRPPRSIAPWAVFEVSTSSLKVGELGENDFEEATLARKYILSLTCGAWVRSKNEEVATMPAGADVEVVLNSGTDDGVETSYYAVSGEPDSMLITMDDSSGDLVVSMNSLTLESDYAAWIEFTGLAIDPSVTPLLIIEGDYVIGLLDPFATEGIRVTGPSGSTFIPLVSSVATPDGWRRYYRLPPATVWTSIVLSYTWGFVFGTNPFGATATFQRILAVDAPASIGSLRQKMFDLDVKGSVVARGAIEVGNDDPVGTTLVYSFLDPTDGHYMPALGPWWDTTYSTATNADDANTASGKSHEAGTGQQGVYNIPLGTLPDGTYDIVMKARGGAAGGHPVITPQVHVGTGIARSLPPFTPTFDYNAGVLRFYTVGQVSLPLLRVPEVTDARLVLYVVNPVAAESVYWDDIYLLNVDAGAYTLLEHIGSPADDPSSASPNFVLLESPTFAWPAQSIMVGVRGAPSSLFSPPGAQISALGRHELEPGRNRVLVVTDAVDSEAAARYFPRGHTNLEW